MLFLLVSWAPSYAKDASDGLELSTENQPLPELTLEDYVATALETFPMLADRSVGRVAIMPVHRTSDSFYRWRRTHPEVLQKNLESILESTFHLTVVPFTGPRDVEIREPFDTEKLLQIADSSQVDALVLHDIEADGNRANIKVIVFTVANAVPLKVSASIPGTQFGLVSWNPTFWLLLLALFGVIAVGVARVRRRGWGDIDVRLPSRVDQPGGSIRIIASRNPVHPTLRGKQKPALLLWRWLTRTSDRTAPADPRNVRFLAVPAGQWWIHSLNTSKIAAHQLTKKVVVDRDRAVFVSFQAETPAPLAKVDAPPSPTASPHVVAAEPPAASAPDSGPIAAAETRSLLAGDPIDSTVFEKPPARKPSLAAATKIGVPDLAGGNQLMFERYRVIAEVGRGGMGVVYKAHDTKLDRDVAIKVITDKLQNNAAVMTLFLQEAKALAQLNHPNIVAVHDLGDEQSRPYLVMEFVEGTTMDELLKRRDGSLTAGRTLDILIDVCAGLAYAHDRRVIHRDIKPANIFLSNTGLTKIGDFGLARVMRELSVHRTESRGTPAYMAPEQILGKNVTTKSDLYSLGCTLFEALVGRAPFTGDDVLRQHMHSPPPRASALNKVIPSAIDDLILHCMAKRADDRIESAMAIRQRLLTIRSETAFGGN